MERLGRLIDLVRATFRGGSPAIRRLAMIVAVAPAALAPGCQDPYASEPPPPDEAMVRAMKEDPPKTAEQAARDYFYPPKLEDYFCGMDTLGEVAPDAKGEKNEWPDQLLDRKPTGDDAPKRVVEPPKLNAQEAFGRNAWMIWCAGNEGFWDWLANHSYGSSDVLKALDSRKRSTLFGETGLINEPETAAPGAPEETDFGLWLNVPSDLKRRASRTDYLRQAFARIEAGQYPDEGGYSYPAGGYEKKEGGEYEKKEGEGYEKKEGEGYEKKEDQDPCDPRYRPEPSPAIYGLSSGVIGLRLFPNPKFDKKAREHWDPKRYYGDESYYSDPGLVRPFRVGMSCAFCHASFHPLKPPRDLVNPSWENISGNIGAQYLHIRGVFANLLGPENFVYHVLDSQPPGTIDTSLIPSDNINNTNAMNSIFQLLPRLELAKKLPRERLAPASAALPSIWKESEFPDGKLPKGFEDSNDNPRRVPRVLFDGADSVGTWTALSRVYLNIGEYWEQWIRIHNPLVGFEPQKPFRIDDCKAYSVYWNATQLRVAPMRDYFLRISPPMRLTDVDEDVDRTAPVDEAVIRKQAKNEGRDPEKAFADERATHIDTSKLKHGRRVFARNCIVCHSSVQPPERFAGLEEEAKNGEFWDHNPGKWLGDAKYMEWAEKAVEDPKFWVDNYLSTDYRIPINLVRTNSARAMATNAMADHMWSDFSSADYHKLPSVGSIRYFNPYKGEEGGEDQYTPRHKAPEGLPGGGGPGFYRVPTLISIWTTAPLLHNNSLGLFNNDPSTAGRLLAFDDAIRKLLWPEKRLESSSYNGATAERLKEDHGLIWRTPVETHLTLPARIAPDLLASRVKFLMKVGDWLPRLENPLWLLVPAALFLLSWWFVPYARWNSTRFLFGYLPLLLALALVVLFALSQGWLGEGRPSDLRRGLLLPAALVLASYFVLLYSSRGAFRFLAGYVPLVFGLILGFVIFFVNGKLGDVRIGPIPKGTPVNLLASINPEADPADLKQAVGVTLKELSAVESMSLSDEEKQKRLKEKVAPALMKVSRCPDFVMDEGHYYEWFKAMTDADKDALIELLKTF